MKYHYKMESILVLSAVLCALLLLKLIYNLRSTLIWRVNCWFCNHNFWVKYIERNSWSCPKCEQYNGFTKDGDYNKVLNTGTEQISKSPKLFQRSPPKNGLCKMCNINQQLKVTQLANFVPMNENNYDKEIESYRNRLEKAYKLCSPCKNILQVKLHKEKETLLDSKLLETRTTDKFDIKKEKQKEITRNINNVSNKLGMIIFILVAIECYTSAMKHKALHKNTHLSNTIYNIKQILYNLIVRIISIVKMKTLLTFPSLENFIDINNIVDRDIFTSFNSGLNDLTQLVLGGFVCLIQIIGLFTNKSKSNYSMIIDTLWIIFEVTCIGQRYVKTDALLMSLIKLSSVVAVLVVYRSMNKTVKIIKRKNITPKNLKNLANGSPKKMVQEDDISSLDTDDDVSLTKFGLHNFTDSSNDTLSPINKSLMNGRSFTPRSDSMWVKPKLNSTFSVNSVTTTNPNLLSNSVFVKPSFNKYQKLAQDSDSDIDESIISSLCISSPKKKSSKMNPVFALRKFTATPNFVAPIPLNKARPLISPSKLGHTTSWVAGGYWGTEGERQIFNVNVSRSSSQSSGFESQASSMNQRNIFSQPPSCEGSVCGEQDRLSDKCQNFNVLAFTPISTPVFPQMQYNSHVQIPQPRMPKTFVSQNVFQQYSPNSIFKAPVGSRLIKLPQENITPH